MRGLCLHQLALASDKKILNAMITYYLKAEQNPLLKLTPLFIKDFGVNVTFSLTAEQSTTALLTNLGAVTLPEDMKPYVETVNDKLVITFSDAFAETDVEREFFTHFVKNGVHVKIESNRY